MAGKTFGCIPNLFEQNHLGIEDVHGNAEPLPTLVPYEQYQSSVSVYSLDMSADVFMAMMQEFTRKAARQYQAETWSYAVQWSHKPPQCCEDAAKPAEKADNARQGPAPSNQPQLGTNQPIGETAVAANEPSNNQPVAQTSVTANKAKGKQPIPRIDPSVLDPAIFHEEGVVRLLFDIVQIDSTLVPNFIEILYRWIDNFEGDGTALRAAVQREIPSLFDFDYHPIEINKFVNREWQKKLQEKGAGRTLPVPKNPHDPQESTSHPLVDPLQGGNRLLYREVKFGIQPPKIESSLPPLINIPEDQPGRVKYYGACWKSRQTALQILSRLGYTPAQVGNYVRHQKSHPNQSSKDGDWKTLPGFKHYFKDAKASQEWFRARAHVLQAQEKQCEIARSSRLALEAAVAAGDVSWEDAKAALLPEKPYPNRRDEPTGQPEKDDNDKPRMKIALIPHPLIGQLKSKVFEGATSEEAIMEKKHNIREQVRRKAEEINQRLKDRIAQPDPDEGKGETERLGEFDKYIERQELSDWYKRENGSNTNTDPAGTASSQSGTQRPAGQGLFSSVQAGPSAPAPTRSAASPPVLTFPTLSTPTFASSQAAAAPTNAPSQGLSMSSLENALPSGTTGQAGLSGTSAPGTTFSLFGNTAPPAGNGSAAPMINFGQGSSSNSNPFAHLAPTGGFTSGAQGPNLNPYAHLAPPNGYTTATPTNSYSQGPNPNPFANLAPPNGNTTAAPTNAASQGASSNPFSLFRSAGGFNSSASASGNTLAASSTPFSLFGSAGGSTSAAPTSGNTSATPSNRFDSAFHTSAVAQSGSAGASTLAQISNAPAQAASANPGHEGMTSTDLATDIDGEDTSPATAEDAENLLGKYHVSSLQHGSTLGFQQLNTAATQNVTTAAPTSAPGNASGASSVTATNELVDFNALMQATGTSNIYDLSRLLQRRKAEGLPIDLESLKHDTHLRKLGVPASTPSDVLNARRSDQDKRKMTIVVHFPNVVVPANGLGPNGTRLGNNNAAETDAYLIGSSKPGSGRIYFERAIYLPVGVTRNMHYLTLKGDWNLVEKYHDGPAQQAGEGGYAHMIAHRNLAAAFAYISCCAISREHKFTKRWRVTPGMMTATQRGSIWEGYAVSMRRRDWGRFRMCKRARDDAVRAKWEIDGEEERRERQGVDEEEIRAISEARRAEIEQMLEENEDEEDEMWGDDDVAGGEGNMEPAF